MSKVGTQLMPVSVPSRRIVSLTGMAPTQAPSPRSEPKFGQYVLGQTLGEGEFGKVKLGWLAKRDGTKEHAQVAIKLIRKETLGGSRSRMNKVEREISVLRRVHHPNIVKCKEVIETDKFIGIILEYASGGELFDFILSHRYLKDNIACRLFAQLVSAVQYLHANGIVHRDLKLENLLLDRNRNVIVTDFGFANTFKHKQVIDESATGPTREFFSTKDHQGDLMQTSCGSPCYAAPELVVSDGPYLGQKVDVWSCGVILYAMLAGYLPFDDDPSNPEGDNISLLYKYIMSTPLTFPEYVSPLARDLLRRVLVPDPRKRYTLKNVTEHTWLAAHASLVISRSGLEGTRSSVISTTAESQAMIRSSSERSAQPTTFVIPKANYLVANGFSRENAVSKPSNAGPESKRHTMHFGQDMPAPVQTRISSIPRVANVDCEVASLSIPAVPGVARSASHSGMNMLSQPVVTKTNTSSEVGLVISKSSTRLPAPRGKPRPTSYHPAYTRHTDGNTSDRRLPFGTVDAVPPKNTDPLAVHAVPAKRNSQRWSQSSNFKLVKTASPKSTKQHASGEIYVSPSGEVQGSQQLSEHSSKAPEVRSSHRPTHKRNSSSITSMVAAIGRLWPTVSQTTSRSVANPAHGFAQMDSIGETHVVNTSDPCLSSNNDKRVPSIAKQGTAIVLPPNCIADEESSDQQSDASTTQSAEAVKDAYCQPIINDRRSSTSGARRIIEFFTNKRRARDQ